MARKHFAIAKVKRMRDRGQLPPKNNVPKNFRTMPVTDFKVEIIDFKNVNTKDQQLSPDNSDELHFEFIDFLLENMLYDLADTTLGYINDHNTEKYLLTLSKIRVL